MKNHLALRIASWTLTAVEGLALAVITYYLSRVLPIKYLCVAIGAFILILGAQIALNLGKNKVKSKTITNIVISSILILTSVLVVCELRYVYQNLEKTQHENQQKTTTKVNVYVRNDDDIQTIQDLAGKTLGIEENLDKEHSNLAVQLLEETIDASIGTKSLDGIPGMVFGLRTSEVDAILLNEEFVSAAAEIDDTFTEWAMLLTIVDVSEGATKPTDSTKEAKESTKATEVANTTEASTDPTDPTDSTEAPEEHVVRDTDHRIDRVIRDIDVTQDTFVVYIQGLDTRGGALIPKTGNSDVNILAFVNPKLKKVLLLSTPRDYSIKLWGNADKPDKLTHCGYYGIDCSLDALMRLYDINIDFYAKVGFNSVTALVDALGGVTVNSAYEFEVDGYTYVKGENEMDGAMALRFCRERYKLAGGDRARGKNQQSVITAIINKVSTVNTLEQANAVLEAFTSNVVTDVSIDNMNKLIKMQLDDLAVWSVESIQVDGTGRDEYLYSLKSANYVMYPDQATVDNAKARIQAFLAE